MKQTSDDVNMMWNAVTIARSLICVPGRVSEMKPNDRGKKE